MMKFCLKFGMNKITPEEVGNKAYMLSKVNNIASIPKGFCITTKAFVNFIEKNNIKEVTDRIIKSFIQKEISADEASLKIRNAFKKGEISDDIIHEINNNISNLKPPFAIRSSSTAEDTAILSFAGLFDSFLFVNHEDTEGKIKEVYASLFNKRVIDYAYGNGIDLRKIRMGVIIQEMISGDKFGTGFYFSDPEDVFILESVIGDPSGVTGGTTIPDTYIIRNNKLRKYPKKININSLFEYEIRNIISLIQKLKEKCDPIDIEWAIGKGHLFLLQIRPLTRKIPIPKGEQLFNGLPASLGYACGNAVIWDKQANLEKGKDKILIAEEIEIEDVGITRNFGGVVLEVSGITAHAAILAREIEIPCIVGVNEITKIIKPGEKICIDGSLGKITLPEKNDFSIERRYVPMYINPRNLKYFRWKHHMVLFYPDDHCAVVYHAGLKDELKEITQGLSKKIKQPLVDGGVDVWYGYGMILEMSQLKKEIYNDFFNALKAVETLSPQKTLENITIYLGKSKNYCSEADKSVKLYFQTKNKKHLFDALQIIDFAFAYWKIVGHCMLYDYAENIINRRSNVPDASVFQKFIIDMGQDKKLQEHGDVVVKHVEQILEIIQKDLAVDYSLYTSEIVLLSQVREGEG